MPLFKVKCYEGAVWDYVEPRAIEAQNEQEAAERVCGEPLSEAGMAGLLRAKVWPVSRPGAKKLFYCKPDHPRISLP